MKKDKIIYWITTVIISVMMFYTGISYFIREDMKGSFVHLGFPDYFRIQLGIAKIIGAAILLLPVIPVRFKDFVYAGFGIAYVSAFIAHVSIDDPIPVSAKALVLLGILIVSFIYLQKSRFGLKA